MAPARPPRWRALWQAGGPLPRPHTLSTRRAPGRCSSPVERQALAELVACSEQRRGCQSFLHARRSTPPPAAWICQADAASISAAGAPHAPRMKGQTVSSVLLCATTRCGCSAADPSSSSGRVSSGRRPLAAACSLRPRPLPPAGAIVAHAGGGRAPLALGWAQLERGAVARQLPRATTAAKKRPAAASNRTWLLTVPPFPVGVLRDEEADAARCCAAATMGRAHVHQQMVLCAVSILLPPPLRWVGLRWVACQTACLPAACTPSARTAQRAHT